MTSNHVVPQNGPRGGNARGDAARVLRPALPAVIADFQSDAVELEERPPPRVAKVTLYALAMMMICAVTWASVSQLDEVVVASGKLITTQPTMVVQPLETSIIRSIDVAVGDVVKRGQILAVLDPTVSQADVDQQQERFASLDAQVKRIEVETAGGDYEPTDNASPHEQLQLAVFKQRKAFFLAQIRNFDAQMAGQLAAIASGKEQEGVLTSRLDNLARIEASRQSLYSSDAGSLLLLLNARDARLDVGTDLSSARGEAADAEHSLERIAAEKQAFIEDFRRTLMEQLTDLRNQRDLAAEELKKMELRRNMVELRAAADSVVLDLAKRSVGSVVQEAEPIVTLVPINVPLEAEVSVGALDIARVAPDDPVRVKIDAYPFQKFGTASGTVRVISRDAFTPTQQEIAAGQSPMTFFKMRVALDSSRLRPDQPVQLVPGMTISAEVKVGRRTVISYLIYPIVKGFDTALREP